ncbi:hypothetical protein HYH03_016490 [Edaphochlamys debaryana]|uniref:Origin recognition complex subunit 6 n=1 Tax=Edaphochlamys debaryana TaxID=47281 RepID=A0A835XIL8_9CHLO|nr:hypothetical protein HYH03_016490 [Edaphochlamys debaryana]|eukprot:KAG2484743.1 hypothetical protein HYH03_016490 [Edaphochlamys debaryana]
MDFKQLAKSLGITQQAALSRAGELLRLLKVKFPGSLGQGEICRPAVCLELACQTTPGAQLPLRQEFIRYSCTAPKVYNECFTRVQRLLDVRPALDLRELVTLFGCSQLHDSTQQLLQAFKARTVEALPSPDRARADLSRPAFLAAAFLLSAKKHKATVDRNALMAKMGITRGELTTALEDMAQRCKDLLGAVGTAAGTRKRARGEEGNGEQQDGEQAGPSGRGASTGARPAAGAKRSKRSAAARLAEEEGEEEAEHAGSAAVEDLKLVLIGLAPPPSAPRLCADDDEEEAEARRRKAQRRAEKRAKAAAEGAVACEAGTQGGDGCGVGRAGEQAEAGEQEPPQGTEVGKEEAEQKGRAGGQVRERRAAAVRGRKAAAAMAGAEA